jgi:cytochrome P450
MSDRDPGSALYDPHSPTLQDHLYETYRILRDEHPVYHNPEREIWVVTRYDDVAAVLQDAETFSSAGVDEDRILLPMIVYMDEPRHKRLRELLSSVFTPRRVASLEPRIRSAARELLDGLAGAGTCELMHGFAAQLPSLVICELIGIPAGRRAAFLDWTGSMIETGAEGHPIQEPAERIYREFDRLLRERREEPRDDLMSALLSTEVDGVGLSDEELLGFCFNLVVGGTDTTMNLIGNGAVLLARHPEQRRLLADDPARIPDAIEEVLRFEAPTQSLPRRPVRDVEWHGVRIPKDCRLLVTYGAANHDERAFDDAERFDVSRGRTRHLSFGLGAHHCLGASLARLEGRIAFEELLGRHPDYQLLGRPGWVTSRWARAHPEVRLRLSA